MTGRRRRGNGRLCSCTLFLVLAVMTADAESIVRSRTDETSQPRGIGDVSRGQHQGYEAQRLQDTVAALPSGFEFTEAVARDAVNARAAGDVGRLETGALSQKLYQTHEGGPSANPSGERYHASATDHYGGLGNFGGSGDLGFPDAMRYYHYGSGEGPKAYNTQHAYAYEKVYPERTYSTNHATSYEKHYDDDNNKGRPWGGGYESRYSSSYPIRGGGGGYGFRHGDSYGSGKGSGGYGSGYTIGYRPKGGGYGSRYDSRPAAASSSGSRRGGGRAGPKIKRYVYKNPYDQSTTRVVQMHSSSGPPSWAASSENRQLWKPDGMEHFVLGLMRDA